MRMTKKQLRRHERRNDKATLSINAAAISDEIESALRETRALIRAVDDAMEQAAILDREESESEIDGGLYIAGVRDGAELMLPYKRKAALRRIKKYLRKETATEGGLYWKHALLEDAYNALCKYRKHDMPDHASAVAMNAARYKRPMDDALLEEWINDMAECIIHYLLWH